MNEIRDALNKIKKPIDNVVIGTVVSVDMTELTCEVAITDDDVITSSLVVGDKNKGLIQIPKIGSIAVVSLIGNLDGFVIMMEEIDKIIIKGGELGGLIKVEELKKQLKIMTNRIDTIINALKNAPTAAQDGGAAFKAAINTTLSTITEKEDYSSIEDETITH